MIFQLQFLIRNVILSSTAELFICYCPIPSPCDVPRQSQHPKYAVHTTEVSIAHRRREEPEEHVGLGAGVGGDEAGVALQVCYVDALHGLDHPGQLPPRLDVSALGVNSIESQQTFQQSF